MENLTKELVAIVLQHLNENQFPEAARMLEQESGIFFNVKYLEEKVLAGEWEELEKYFLGFTKIDENRHSVKIFFEIRKQKYLEALDRKETDRAIDILKDDLKVFSSYDEDMYKEMGNLLILENIRENAKLSDYTNAQTSRREMVVTLKQLVEVNPIFREKLAFPSFSSARLINMLNQSLNMQHSLCENWRPLPEMKTLLTDHVCEPLNMNMASASSLGVGNLFQLAGASNSANTSANQTGNNVASLLEPAVATATCLPVLSNQGSIRPPLPSAAMGSVDYPNTEYDQLMKRLRSTLSSDEHQSTSNFLRATTSINGQRATPSLDNLPIHVACVLHQGSAVTSMDFHPTRHTLLIVGSANGELTLWELRTEEKVVSKPFMIGHIDSHSPNFQAIYARNRNISVIRVLWSPDGGFIGVAFNKHLIHLYAYAGQNDLQQLVEVEAHNGLVNDLAFVHPEDRLCVATCGDDKLVKVWDLNGQKLYTFEGHQAPVYSICPHQMGDTQIIMSTSIDGKIMTWVYDDLRSRNDFMAPGHWCTTLLLSNDRSRLFSCGTDKQGDSFLVEWDESQGKIKRMYRGLIKKPAGLVVHFDTTQNKFLAVGEDNQIKFWDMSNVDILTSTYAEGELSSHPRLKFNKEGNLLAVSTTSNGFKILATAASLRSLKSVEASPVPFFRSPTAFKASSSSSAAAAIFSTWNSNLGNSLAGKSSAPILGSSIAAAINVEDFNEENSAASKQILNPCENEPEPEPEPEQSNNEEPITLAEITDPVQCQLITMPQGDNAAEKVLRLLYTHSGSGLFALGSNSILTVWKWQANEQNRDGKATTRVIPQKWKPERPNSENVMINKKAIREPLEDHVSFLALSNNDYYAVSAYGGEVTLFNTQSFKFIVTFMAPPPVATCAEFNTVNNNIIAVGMEDATISIYQVRRDEEIAILRRHMGKITGLAFSAILSLLISSGADGMLCSWNTTSWVLLRSVPVQMLAGIPITGETWVQIHPNHVHFLVTQERMLAVYDALRMRRIISWVPQRALSTPITCATFSGDGQIVYASLRDGSIWVLDTCTMRPIRNIASSTYSLVIEPNGGEDVYPLCIAGHPTKRNQFAIGLSNGSVKVMEPLASEGEWGNSPPSGVGSVSLFIGRM